MAAGSLPGVGTIGDVTSQAGSSPIARNSGAGVGASTSQLNTVANGGGPTSANPTTPTSSGVNPNAQNPNMAGGQQNPALQELVNMRIQQSPSLQMSRQDAASRLAGMGLQNKYTPTGAGLTSNGGSGGGNSTSLINDAKSWLGVPYQYGGTSRSGVDCSGFTQAVYSQVGINIGRDTTAQFRSGQRVGQDGNWNASVQALQPGDLIFYGQPGASGPNAHVVMYVGNGQVIQAAHTGTNVAISPLFSAASGDEPFLGVRRYLSQAAPAAGGGVSGNAYLGALQADGSNAQLGRQQFANALLAGLGDRITPQSVQSIVNWETREGGNWGDPDTFNPLNTTQPYGGSHGTNGVGVQAYNSWLNGLNATIQTLRNGRYNDILGALARGGGLNGYLPGLGTWSGGGYYSI